jgi:hypothetical protein
MSFTQELQHKLVKIFKEKDLFPKSISSELRIGNFIYKNYPKGNVIEHVYSVSEYFINGLGVNVIEGIPLTMIYSNDFKIEIQNTNKSLELIQQCDGFYPVLHEYPKSSTDKHQFISLNSIKFIHEWQNLHFELTGKEIEINLQ